MQIVDEVPDRDLIPDTAKQQQPEVFYRPYSSSNDETAVELHIREKLLDSYCNSKDQPPMNNSLDEIDDEEFAKDLHEKVKAKNFAAGVPIVYQEDEDDMDCEWYIVEYPNGDKKRVHVEDLDKV